MENNLRDIYTYKTEKITKHHLNVLVSFGAPSLMLKHMLGCVLSGSVVSDSL